MTNTFSSQSLMEQNLAKNIPFKLTTAQQGHEQNTLENTWEDQKNSKVDPRTNLNSKYCRSNQKTKLVLSNLACLEDNLWPICLTKWMPRERGEIRGKR